MSQPAEAIHAEEPVTPSVQAAEQAAEPELATPLKTLPLGTIASGISLALASVIFGVAWIMHDGSEQQPAVVAAPDSISQPESISKIEPEFPEKHSSQELVSTTEEEPVVSESFASDQEPVATHAVTQPEVLPNEPQELDTPEQTIAVSHEEPVNEVTAEVITPEVSSESIDPLEFDPESIDLVLIREGTPAEEIEPASVAMADPPRTLSPPKPSDLIDAQLAQAARNGGIMVRRGPSNDPHYGAPQNDARESLGQTLPEIDLKKIPFHNALELIAQLSDVPISLDPFTFKIAGVDPYKPINIAGEDIQLSETLANTLKQARLTYQVDGAHAVVELPEHDRPRTVKHKLKDLAGSNLEELAELLKLIGPAGPNYDFLISEQGILPVTVARETQYELWCCVNDSALHEGFLRSASILVVCFGLSPRSTKLTSESRENDF